MPILRVLSWNLRTFGTHELRDVDVVKIANIIANSQADVACIQELMIGKDVGDEIGSPISQLSLNQVEALRQQLAAGDPKAEWVATVSGIDAGVGKTVKRMRDAYAFLIKTNPAASTLSHTDPVTAIHPLSEPVILRQPGNDCFTGRRPGMQTINVLTDAVTPVNIVSFHAATPTNTYSKGKGSGYSITELATLPEIGGGMLGSDGRAYYYEEAVLPLPQIDTIVLGDFNYTMDDGFAPKIYQNLLTNYDGCISNAQKVRYTTYAPSGTEPLRLISAYDNIFVLKPHKTFAPALTKGNVGVIDFIADDAHALGTAIGFQYLDNVAEPAWYVIHQDLYKRQHASRGISDHLPVWADFTVGSSKGQTASHILPTSGANNNCLFHAVFGVLRGGQYVDDTAPARRLALEQALRGYGANTLFPSLAVRGAVLEAMINEFDGDPGALALLRPLLANAVNPFTVVGVAGDYALYIGSIGTGRMLWVGEALLVAIQNNITINLTSINRGQYVQLTLNQGSANSANIFHQVLHYQRWQP